jgi:hypothetical protein
MSRNIFEASSLANLGRFLLAFEHEKSLLGVLHVSLCNFCFSVLIAVALNLFIAKC